MLLSSLPLLLALRLLAAPLIFGTVTIAQPSPAAGRRLLLGQAICDGSRCGLINNAHHVQACDGAGVLGGLALGVIEVRCGGVDECGVGVREWGHQFVRQRGYKTNEGRRTYAVTSFCHSPDAHSTWPAQLLSPVLWSGSKPHCPPPLTWYSDHCVSDSAPQVRLRRLLHLAQNERADFLRAELLWLALHLDLWNVGCNSATVQGETLSHSKSGNAGRPTQV